MKKFVDLIKKYRLDIVGSAVVIIFLIEAYWGNHLFSITVFVYYIFLYVSRRDRERIKLEELKRLELKGLTPEDLQNIKFVKEWEDTRKKGLVKYVVMDGGIFFGFAMCLVISIVFMIIKHDAIAYMSAGPANMFSFIGYSYIAGVLGGALIYRLLWVYKEKKFADLTDPLHQTLK